VTLTFFGHAAFLVEAVGLRIVLDPYRSPDSGGYAPIDVAADLVVVSHENDRYHSHLGQIRGPFEVVRALELPPGGREIRGLRFEAIPVFETPEKLPGDEVTIVHFRVEGLHVAFLGDLGHALDASEVAPLRGCDLLIVPAGGPPTIALELVAPLVESIAPRWVVPMHYLTPRINLALRPVDDFLAALPGLAVERTGQSTATIVADRLRDRPTILCLEPSR